ncbi:MAG: phenylalanine--tRNA ligase beta subunit-related protein, partial [Spirochaetota bacterium]|nr:phenylalanine--tRNA ligase beta subunit-related protein [Spirochaetota bacterium]
LKQLEMLQPYVRYFKSYKKTYHLFLQLESFVHKDKPLPFITPLVSAYFLAELETGVLASAHDLDKIVPGLTLTAAAGGETLTLINGEERTAPAGDALLKDGDGLLTCVIQGQDSRTVLGPGSRNAAYFVYGPSGVSGQDLSAALTVLSDHLAAWYGDHVKIEEIPREEAR